MVKISEKNISSVLIECIDNNQNFLFEAGAGAGKTYSLIEAINHINQKTLFINKKAVNILCITYTNVAKDEVNSRLKYRDNVTVNTMHEFLWSFISPFQNEIKKIVEEMIKEELAKVKKSIEDANRILAKPRSNTNIEKKISERDKALEKEKRINVRTYNKIKYENYRALEKGIISHDDLLQISGKLFENKVFVNLFLDLFSHVFIDEFQDTNKLFLNKLLQGITNMKGEKVFILGLFGDKMQQIYDNGTSYIDADFYKLKYISETANYRSCKEIVKSNNLLRNDGFEQVPKNPDITLDEFKFIYNMNSDKYLKSYSKIRAETYTKIYLTHKEIAAEIGFLKISMLFSEEYNQSSNDKLLKLEDEAIKHVLEDMISIIKEYQKGNYSYLISRYKGKVCYLKDLKEIKQAVESIISNPSLLLKDLIEKFKQIEVLNEDRLKAITKRYSEREKQDFTESLFNIEVTEFLSLYTQIFEETGLRTMHGIKGEEFENLIINIYEDSPWPKYNFQKLFLNGLETENSVSNRTHKLFYVGCTRAKKSLIINYICTSIDESLKEKIFSTITNFFGEEIRIESY